MITEEQINRVHLLMDKWNITDPVKQHCKMGEEIGEYLEVKDSLKRVRVEEMRKEMGDMWFTLIGLCKQLGIDFQSEYKRMRNHVLVKLDSYMFTHFVSVHHMKLGGHILKNKVNPYLIAAIIRNWLEECRTQEFDESVCLEAVIAKNENKAGKTVNGVFVKEADLKSYSVIVGHKHERRAKEPTRSATGFSTGQKFTFLGRERYGVCTFVGIHTMDDGVMLYYDDPKGARKNISIDSLHELKHA